MGGKCLAFLVSENTYPLRLGLGELRLIERGNLMQVNQPRFCNAGVDLNAGTPPRRSKPVSESFHPKSLLKSASNYPAALFPEGFTASSDFDKSSLDLMNRAGAIVDRHEDAQLGGLTKLNADDWVDLANKHQALSDAHRALSEALKASGAEANVQAVGAHDAASKAHAGAFKVSQMMNIPTGMAATMPQGQERVVYAHEGWDNPMKAWKAAHRAFIASKGAYDRTVFETE